MIHKAVTSSSFGVMNLGAFISANNLQTPEAIAKIANSEKLNTKDSVKFKEIATAIKDKLFAHNQLECNSNKKNIITPPKAVPESQNQRINNIMLILAFLSVVGDFIVQPLVSLYPNEARAMIERSKQIFLPLEKNLKHIVKTSKKIGVCLTKTNINVKTKPGKNSKTFLKLPPHTPVVVFDSYKRWNRIGFRINGQAIEGFCENKNLHKLRARQE